MAGQCWAAAASRSSITYGAFAIVLLIASALRAQQPSPDPGPIPPPSQPAPNFPTAPTAPVAPTNPPAGASPSSHMMRVWRQLKYTCDGDVKVVVNLHAKQARVVLKGPTYNPPQGRET